MDIYFPCTNTNNYKTNKMDLNNKLKQIIDNDVQQDEFKQIHEEDKRHEQMMLEYHLAEENKKMLGDIFKGFGDAFTQNFQR